MEIHVEGFGGEVVVEHYFAAHECFEGKRGEHVESETETCYVDHDVVSGEVVEHVALGEVAEG